MSQAAGKRSRKRLEDETETGLKNGDPPKTRSPPKPEENFNKLRRMSSESDEQSLKGFSSDVSTTHSTISNGSNDLQVESVKIIETRSRSQTPQQTNHDLKASTKVDEVIVQIEQVQPKKALVEAVTVGTDTPQEKEEEEPYPELTFDENDVDVESEESPNRCKTRRSQSRNISTPKTPKVVEQNGEDDEAKLDKLLGEAYVSLEQMPKDPSPEVLSSTPKKTNTNASEIENSDVVKPSLSFNSVGTNEISMYAFAGGDTTRNESLTYPEVEDNSGCASKERSVSDMLRSISPRRPIRPIADEYRKHVLRKYIENKGNCSMPEMVRQSGGTIAGVKRKERSVTPDNSKRFKPNFPGILSYLNPLNIFKFNTQKYNLSSSTPKLMGYTDHSLEPDDVSKIEVNEDVPTKSKWCVIM